MNKAERQALKAEFNRPLRFIINGLAIIGLLLSTTGFISTVKILQHIGAIMVFVGWFMAIIIRWKRGKTGLMMSISLVLLGIIGIITYSYLI